MSYPKDVANGYVMSTFPDKLAIIAGINHRFSKELLCDETKGHVARGLWRGSRRNGGRRACQGCSAFPAECPGLLKQVGWLVVFFWGVLIYLVGWGGRMHTGW